MALPLAEMRKDVRLRMKLPLDDVSGGAVSTLGSTPVTTSVTTAAGIDRQVALSRVGGDAELLKEIAQLFIDDYPRALEDIREAANRGDAKSLERSAHGLKGSVANFGASSAVEAARKLESMGRAAQLAEAQQVIHTLELALAALRPELESL
jgi:HPt (histidine-containing phosphotransfer) domain-containing protein